MKQPRLGVLSVCLSADAALLVRRRNPPDAGLWGFPGGKVDWGENVAQAATRELAEETGIAARAGAMIDAGDFITRDTGGEVLWHYYLVAIACHIGRDEPVPEPVAGDDALEARFVPDAEILQGGLPMSAGVPDLLQKARARI